MSRVEQHIVETLDTMKEEVSNNGISEVACDLWSHALEMYRKHRSTSDRSAEDTQFLDMPLFLRKQAE